MKSYDNKKFYNYSLKHKRKKRIRATMKYWKAGSIYTELKRREFRNKCKVILRKQIQGEQIEFPLYKKTMWWDS